MSKLYPRRPYRAGIETNSELFEVTSVGGKLNGHLASHGTVIDCIEKTAGSVHFPWASKITQPDSLIRSLASGVVSMVANGTPEAAAVWALGFSYARDYYIRTGNYLSDDYEGSIVALHGWKEAGGANEYQMYG